MPKRQLAGLPHNQALQLTPHPRRAKIAVAPPPPRSHTSARSAAQLSAVSVMPQPEPYRRIWEAIAPYDAVPALRIGGEPRDRQVSQLREVLKTFARGRTFMVDSTTLEKGPAEYSSAAAAIEDHDHILEFVAVFADGTYWAVTEEEYEWLVFTGEWNG